MGTGRKRKVRFDMADTLFPPGEDFVDTPEAAADQLDAILFFIQKHYSGNGNKSELLNLYSLLVSRADVVFTEEVKHVILEKKPTSGILFILSPPVSKSKEEEHRINLLNDFGDLIIKCQRQAYEQIRHLLFGILDSEGKEKMVQEFLKFKSESKNLKEKPT